MKEKTLGTPEGGTMVKALAIGGEVAARSDILLRDVGITCRLCVAGQKTEWEAGHEAAPMQYMKRTIGHRKRKTSR